MFLVLFYLYAYLAYIRIPGISRGVDFFKIRKPKFISSQNVNRYVNST